MASTTREWVTFFQKAGIPHEESASYALIFTKNRIQRNMLIDLNKEYLRDMGITLLGDIIAILKHAQSVYETNSRASLLTEPEEITQIIDLTTKKNSSGSSSTVKRLLDHYTKKYKEAEESLSAIPEPEVEKNAEIAKTLVGKKSGQVIIDNVPPIIPEKKSHGSPMNESPIVKNRTLGKAEKKNVFERLGEGTVSSTTSEVKPKEGIKFGNTKPSSIFDRLGVVTSTSFEGEHVAPKHDALPYAGVFKHVAVSDSSSSVLSVKEDPTQHDPPHMTLFSKRLGTLRVAQERNEAFPKKPTTNFLKARELKMLKITTEFAEEKEADAMHVTSDHYQASTSVGHLKRTHGEMEYETARPPPLKKVRFGATTRALIPSHCPVSKSKPSQLLNNFTNLKITAAPKESKQRLGIKSRIGAKPPTPAPFSKMVSDSISGHYTSNRIPIKNRISPKPKQSILDRLG